MSPFKMVSTFMPPPRYLRMPSIGVDISDTSLKYVQFALDSRTGTELNLKNWGDINIKEGTLSRGDVKDTSSLTDALKEVKRRTHIDHVRVSLPEEKAYLFETEIKRGTPFKEVRGLLEFRLEENVPLSPRDAYFDYHIFNNNSDKNVFTVSVTAYAKETITGYYEACQAAGVIPLSFEVEAQAIARAALPKDDSGTHLIVDFGNTRTGIGIVHHGVLVYTSTIDIGGKHLSTALRKQLGEKTESELTEIKNNQGLVRKGKDDVVYEAIISTMSAIKDEIALRIEYWNNLHSGNQDKFIEGVILCGGSVNLNGLTEYLTQALNIETTRAQVWQNVFDLNNNVPAIDLRHSYGYATAVGLGLISFS